MMPPDSFQPLQLKGEVMDLEFTIDTDHRSANSSVASPRIAQHLYRKRRRNRTTQSCLNCHTSKRKCDRKRPCQRCIQLGLTGLCVYEVDDPALRDDPTVDETTRLRNRIAELESLVRELRGKPHPRWADTNFRDGDPNEKWHSRATKCIPLVKRRAPPSPELVENHTTETRNGTTLSTLLTPIKTEAPAENGAPLYRFSPSPAPSMRYHTFQADVRGSPASSFENNDQRPSYPTQNSNGTYNASSGTSSSFANAPHAGSTPSSYSDSSGNYPLSGSDDGRTYSDHHYSPTSPHSHLSYSCPCRTSPAPAHAYHQLSQQLQSTVNAVRQYSHHPSNSNCILYRRVLELHSLMQFRGNDSTDVAGPAYDSSTPTDSEILTPISASSGHNSFHSGSPGAVSPQEWNTLAAASYSSYFPMQSNEHNMYTHVIS